VPKPEPEPIPDLTEQAVTFVVWLRPLDDARNPAHTRATVENVVADFRRKLLEARRQNPGTYLATWGPLANATE